MPIEIDLSGRVALVTGGSRGLGRMDALTLARAGADVVIADLLVESELSEETDAYGPLATVARQQGMVHTESTAEEIRSLGRRALALKCDVTDRDQVAAAVERALDELGAIDILVNNAGTLDHVGQFHDQQPELWERDLRVNLTGAFNCAQAVWPHMKERKWGRIVNMASVAGTLGGFGQASYSTTKAGLLGLTKTLAMEGGRHGITCNAIVPGIIGTEAFHFANPAMNERIAARTVFKRPGEPQDIANAIAWLCSDLAAYVTGIDLGGLTPAQATRLLERRAARLADKPVTFTAAGKRFRLTPRRLGVQVDWAKAVANAQRHGSGFGFIRGYRRLELQLFPADLLPPVKAYEPGVSYEVGLLANAIDRGHREARLVRRGLHITIAPGATGRALERKAAHDAIVGALSSFSRAPVALPVRTDPPTVTVDSLTDAQQIASQVIAAPVTVLAGPTRIRVPRWRLAKILDLRTVSFSGPAGRAYFARLARHLDHAPRDATFAVNASGSVRVVPAVAGVELDVRRSAANVLAAAKRP